MEEYQEKSLIPNDRKKIRNILNQIEIPKEMGIIVRTAGSNKTKNEINSRSSKFTKNLGFNQRNCNEFYGTIFNSS